MTISAARASRSAAESASWSASSRRPSWLPPGSAGVIAIYEHAQADLVDGALANAIRKSTAQIDKASAKELKAGLAEAGAGLGG